MNETENLFKEVMERIGFPVEKSSTKEDMYDHIDFFSNDRKYSFDIKDEKKFSRKDKYTDSNIIWLEVQNVRGDKGWLRGKATHIVMRSSNEFLFISRVKLLNFTLSFIEKSDNSYKEYKKWFNRRGTQDLIAYVYKKDIEHLIERKVKINLENTK